METKTYLFQLTIPSVQKFISSSRKTSDLWAGSFMVSYLMKELLSFAKKEYQAELIYPVVNINEKDEKELIANIPNVAIFMVNNKTGNEIQNIKENLEKRFRKNLENIVGNKNVLEKFSNEKVEIKDIKKAFNIKNDKKAEEILEKRKNIISKYKDEYLELAKYQIKESLKLFIENLELGESSEISDKYKEVSEDLANIINYEKKSQLPDRNFIENYQLIENPFKIEEKSEVFSNYPTWEGFYNNEKNNDFQTGYIKGVYRCSSCGEHTIIGATLDDWRGNLIWKPLWEANPKYFNRGERLCGVCLAKRYFRDYLGSEDIGFPSTSEIAATLFKIKVLEVLKQNPDFNNLLVRFFENLGNIPNFKFKNVKGNPVPDLNKEIDEIFPADKNLEEEKQSKIYKIFQIDGEWFIEDTWKNENDYKIIGADTNEANQMLRTLQNIYDYLKEKEIEKHYKPSEYYAIIMLDGDSIGEKLDKIKELENPVQTHRGFSNELSELSKEFKDIVEENYGALIYSGGDDVLALVPVENALDCANEIQKEFKTKLESKFPSIHKESPFSMSGAIIYAHHKLPLSYVLEEARECEEKAKEEDKNRVCLKYIKRSLSSAEIVVNWNKIKEVYNLVKDLDIPISIIHDIQAVNNTSDIDNLNEKIREFLLIALLKNKVKKEEIDKYMDVFYEIDNFYNFSNLSNTLKVLRFID